MADMTEELAANAAAVPPHHERLKAHLKNAFLKTGHVTEEVAGALATVALSTIGSGAFQQ